MGKARQTAADAPVNPQGWLSARRARIRELGIRRAALTRLALRPDTSDLDAQLNEIDRARAEIRSQHYRRSVRDLFRQNERLAAAEAELEELEHAAQRIEQQRWSRRHQAQLAWAEHEPLHREWQEELDLAAAEEFNRRVGKQRAPWIQNTLGPPPPANRRDLVVRWTLMGVYLAAERITQGIVNPSDPGINPTQGRLISDIHNLRGWIQDARELGPAARKFDPYTKSRYQPGTLDIAGYPKRR